MENKIQLDHNRLLFYLANNLSEKINNQNQLNKSSISNIDLLHSYSKIIPLNTLNDNYYHMFDQIVMFLMLNLRRTYTDHYDKKIFSIHDLFHHIQSTDIVNISRIDWYYDVNRLSLTNHFDRNSILLN